MPLIYPVGFMAASSGISITFQNFSFDNVDRSSYTITAADLGSAAANRYIIASVHSSNSVPDPSALTIGGVSATKAIGSTNVHNSSIWIANVPTGATGDIVVTTGVTNRFCCGWYRATGLTSITPTDTGVGTSATSFSDTLTTVVGGFIIIAATPGYIADGASTSFGGTGIVENYDQVQDDNVRGLGGHATTTETSYAISGTYTGGSFCSTVAASWGT